MDELRTIVRKAKGWRGSLGTQRRVVVSGYELRDPLVPSFSEESTHVAIYKLELSGESIQMTLHCTLHYALHCITSRSSSASSRAIMLRYVTRYTIHIASYDIAIYKLELSG